MKRTVKSILIAAGCIAALGACAVVAFFARHHESRAASAQTAAVEFQTLRDRFAGQQPLLDMDHRQVRGPASVVTAQPLHAFHTVIFDTRGGDRLVHITAPYWLARAFARHDGEFRWLGELTFFDDTEFDPESIRLSLQQVERHGPGLVADYRHPNGAQFISWVD